MKYFLYCRKSTESEDRQMLSIGSQRAELERAFGSQPEIEIIETIEEAFSAKAPGRCLFSGMMARIERGEAEGIIAWAPDRLARNSIDGGKIIYDLDLGILRDLKFASYTFENNSQGKFMLQIMFGQSKFFSDALSDNVKRGNRAKLAKGWWPNRAPLGYQNERIAKTIVRDPVHFPLVRRMFELMLTGSYSSRQVVKIAQEEWGMRTPKRTRSGGRPIADGTAYRVLTNPFYAGVIRWGGRAYPGMHEAVVTIAEFEEVQRRLARPGRKTQPRRSFAYTGMIRCGACGAMVTAEEKINRYGSRYLYYHCTRRLRGPRCTEPSVRVEKLESQILKFLRSLVVRRFAEKWVLEHVRQEELEGREDEEAKKRSLETGVADTKSELRELTSLRLRSLITDEEFVTDRRRLERERDLLADNLVRAAQPTNRFEPARELISFSRQAADWFWRGDDGARRLIFETVGSNALLTGKKLSVDAAKPFSLASIFAGCSRLSGVRVDVRTFSDKSGGDHNDLIAAIHAALDDPECARILPIIALLREGFSPTSPTSSMSFKPRRKTRSDKGYCRSFRLPEHDGDLCGRCIRLGRDVEKFDA